MPDNRPSEPEIFRAVFGPGNECPPIEKLELLTENSTPSEIALARHLESCTYCQTELHLLRTFQSGNAMQNSDDVRQVVERLQSKPLPEATMAAPAPVRSSGLTMPRWRAVFAVPRLIPASLAAAALLLIVTAGVLYFRHSSQPVLEATSRGGQEVFRSSGFAVVSPVGDVHVLPSEIRWEPVQQAAKYQVRLLEVDRSEMWKAETSQDRLQVPSAVLERIVPAKTLFVEIIAFNSSGNKIGETGLIRFRLLQI